MKYLHFLHKLICHAGNIKFGFEFIVQTTIIIGISTIQLIHTIDILVNQIYAFSQCLLIDQVVRHLSSLRGTILNTDDNWLTLIYNHLFLLLQLIKRCLHALPFSLLNIRGHWPLANVFTSSQ